MVIEVFKQELEQSKVDNLMRYFIMLPSEVAMKLWSFWAMAN